MLCKKPYHVEPTLAVSCGQCLPCRIKKRREWTSRIVLESLSHESSSFITLTYSDDFLPFAESGLATLSRRDFTLFLKRFRKAFDKAYGAKLRFFGVGEYGDESGRPHYHAIVFGGCCLAPGSCSVRRSFKQRSVCAFCRMIEDCWEAGKIDVGTCTWDSAQYCAGYTVKKMTSKHDGRLNGREPEFAAPSRRPGIGALSVQSVAQAIDSNDYLARRLFYLDLPSLFKQGGKSLVLGRYMRSKLMEELKVDESFLSEAALTRRLEMRDLWQAHVQDKGYEEALTIGHFQACQSAQKVRQLEARTKLYSSPKRL